MSRLLMRRTPRSIWDNTGAFIRFGAVFESAGDEDDERVLGELAARLANAKLKF